MKSAFQIAMEGNTPDGVKHIERELTLYVLLHDLQDIRELATDEETHEQWNVKTDDPNVRMRIRLTDGVEYTATTKEKTRNQLALQRGLVEGQMAMRRLGAQMAWAAHSSKA